MMRTFFFISTLFGALLLGLFTFPSLSMAAPKIGESAPDFTLKDQRGKEHKLSQYKGKIVVLEWTNPTCPFVVRHYKTDTMTKIASAHPEVVWLTINSSHFTTDQKNQEWAKIEGVKFVLNDKDGSVGHEYEARTTPHMYVINKDGKLVYMGAIDDDPYGDKKTPLNYIAEAIKSLKSKTPVKVAETKAYGCSVKYKR